MGDALIRNALILELVVVLFINPVPKMFLVFKQNPRSGVQLNILNKRNAH